MGKELQKPAIVNTAVDEPPAAKSLHDTLHKNGSFTYDNTTDSLEAISDAQLSAANVNTEVDNALDTAVAEPPTAKSLNDTLHKDGSFTYDNTTDSLEAVSDKVTALNNISTANVNTEVDNALDTIVPSAPTAGSLNDALSIASGANTFVKATDSLEAIRNHLLTQPQIVERATDTLPQGAQEGIFTVTGTVLITQIVGEVTTVIQTQATVFKLVSNPTVGADVNLCATNDITADAVGTLYNVTGTFADALVATTSGAFISQAAAFVVTAGTIDWDTDNDSSSGNIKWTLHYIPLSANGSVVIVAV